MNDYERVARIIEYLGERFREQPDLESIAKVAGLAPHHFHRLFRRWAGITPKSFLRHLTLVEAGRLLRNGTSVLDAAFGCGLSGPGRLHDLCVSLEAASPGEIRSGGEGWRIRAGFAQTPFGDALIAEGPRGVCKLSFLPGKEDADRHWSSARSDWPKALFARDDARAEALAAVIFARGERLGDGDPLKVYVKGTMFQTRVWRALVDIPAGEARTYASIAEAIGSPTAARAVGTAIGKNPIGFIIPCHRVIHATGVVGRYRWGTERKKAILVWERSVGEARESGPDDADAPREGFCSS